MKTTSQKFGLLLAHFFLGKRQALTVSGAAKLCGLRAGDARALLEILAQEGLLCAGRARGRAFLPDTGSPSYRCCLKAYRRQLRTN